MQKRNRKPAEDLLGQRFGKWKIVGSEKVESGGRRRTLWLGRCDCGTERLLQSSALKRGQSTSCGCSMAKHGGAAGDTSPLYRSWRAMKDRCYNPNNRDYHNYGGRGITVCDAWKDDPGRFMADMEDGYTPGMTLDRVDVEKGYDASNCRWADAYVQSNNRRNVRRVLTPDGEDLPFKEAWRRFGVLDYSAACYRARKGWDTWEAITTPPKSKKRR